jgi:hypothetical protein
VLNFSRKYIETKIWQEGGWVAVEEGLKKQHIILGSFILICETCESVMRAISHARQDGSRGNENGGGKIGFFVGLEPTIHGLATYNKCTTRQSVVEWLGGHTRVQIHKRWNLFQWKAIFPSTARRLW